MGGPYNFSLVAAARWLDESARSVGTPGPAVDPYLFMLVAGLCIALLALGIGALIVLYLKPPTKSSRPGKR